VQTLSDLVARSATITQKIIESGGELSPEIESDLSVVESDLALKVDAYSIVMDRLDREGEFFSEKAKQYQAIARAHTKAVERLRERIKAAMISMGKNELSGSDVRFKLTKTAQRLVLSETELDPTYLLTVTTQVPDKERIKSDLLSGHSVRGAALDGGLALRTYINRGESK
jgi:hypothetical protein